MTQAKLPLVLITGASQGIGAAIAECFANAENAFRLALVARNTQNLTDIASKCGNAAQVECFACDVTDEQQVGRMAEQVKARMGEVSVLINNAGVWCGSPVLETSVEQFDAVINTNLRGTFLVSRAFLADMQKSGTGDIFNMSSTAGLEAYPGVSAYCAAKHAVTGFTKSLREELRPFGIRVFCVYPGPTESPSWNGVDTPKGALMPAAEVAKAFLNAYQMSRAVVVEDIVLKPQIANISAN